ncbi:MAG: hypothetical protein JNL97_14075 [Verrucomicrobiales bacterium]|nr:hypothetical protein [Verrucomicrobiales bacterium]
MKFTPVSSSLAAALLLPAAAFAEEPAGWTFETTLYGLAAGMSGEVAVKGISADIDMGFDDVLEQLEFGAMGAFRIGYNRWSLTTDVIFMALGASKGAFNVEMDQWVVEPAIGYRLCRYFEPLVGFRYNNLSGEIHGPAGPNPTGTQDWIEPFVGGNVTVPLTRCVGFHVRGDAGGFGAGAELTWQVFPYVNWHISDHWSLQAGYRWVQTHYEAGSGRDFFKYDVLSQGPQAGFTYAF